MDEMNVYSNFVATNVCITIFPHPHVYSLLLWPPHARTTQKKIGEHFPHKKKIVCVHATEKNDRKKCATCADTCGKSMAFVVQQFQWNIIGTVCNYLFLLCAICSYSLSHAAPIDAIHTYHFWFCR